MSSNFIFSTISGGYFVSQIAILGNVLNAVDNIDAYFGNSGGAIANLVSLKYSGTSKSIEKVLYTIEKDIFVKPWVSNNHPLSGIISPFISLFKSSFYKESKGSKELIEIFYTENEFRNTEFWIGKFNIAANFNELVCTKEKGKSIFNSQLTNTEENKYMEDIAGNYNIQYANGKIDVISETLDSSASIPGYKPPVQDSNGNYYADGGISSASPGSYFSNIFLNYSKTKTDNYHFFYIIGSKYVDRNVDNLNPTNHWTIQIIDSMKSLLNFSKYKDRQILFDTWVKMSGQTSFNNAFSFSIKKGKDELKTFLDSIKDKHYFVTCYTKSEPVNILNFNKEDLKRIYKDAYDNTFFEIFYI